MKLSVIAKGINAQLYGEDQTLVSLAIDSRKVKAGDLFVALKGENFDGHDFILNAIAQGAKAVMAQRAPQLPEEQRVTFLQVKDTTQALGDLAGLWRSYYPVPLVGLTGSCGKTTVKGMLASICQLQGKTLATQGNFNNQVGLPLTLLHLDDSYQYAVIEMGASHIGDIKYLGKIARPTIALITNIKPAHILGFGSIENVAKTKGEIYESLPAQGTAIVNVDEPFHTTWDPLLADKKVITFGLKNKAMVTASELTVQPFASEFILHILDQHCKVHLKVPGEHMVMNALASAAAAFALGISLEKIAEGLGSFEGVSGRLKRLPGIAGACVIDDTYNANPSSMKAALEVLGRCSGQRLFVMGDMAELGEEAASYHHQIGQYARAQGIERLWAVGKLSQYAVQAFGEGACLYDNKTDLITALKEVVNAASTILVKGSRSAKMEMITQALTREEI